MRNVAASLPRSPHVVPIPIPVLAASLPAVPRQVTYPMRVFLVFILSAQCVAMTHAVDCYTNPGTSLHLCDRWIACRDSGGTLCDDSFGTLGTEL